MARAHSDTTFGLLALVFLSAPSFLVDSTYPI